ncbi:MAG: hypothetical protein WCC84_08235 [Candidatus Cybelea sp.]
MKVKTKGGSLFTPALGGFGGSMEYPGVEPQLDGGTLIVYLNLHFHSGTHFGSYVKSTGGLTSQTIHPGVRWHAFKPREPRPAT